MRNVLRQLLDRVFEKYPLLDGQLITGVQLSTAPVDVPHELGRPPVGYFEVSKNANAGIFAPDPQPDECASLRLQATGDVTVSLWVF